MVLELRESKAAKRAKLSWRSCFPPQDPAPTYRVPLCTSPGLGLDPSCWRILTKAPKGGAVPPSQRGDLICPGSQGQPHLHPPQPAFLSTTSKTPGWHPINGCQKSTPRRSGWGLTPQACSSTTRCPLLGSCHHWAGLSLSEGPAAVRIRTGNTPSCSALRQRADQPSASGQQPPGCVSMTVPLPSAGVCTLRTQQRSCYTSQCRCGQLGQVRGRGRWRRPVRPGVLLCLLVGGSRRGSEDHLSPLPWS